MINARKKGHNFERMIAHIFSIALQHDCCRGYQYREGSDAPDVIAPGYWIECKVGKKTSPARALEQAVKACRDDSLIPVAVCKDDRADVTVTLRLEDFVTIIMEKGE